MATIVLGDIVTIVKEVVNPKTCGLDKFVGLEHYDAGEPLITRFGSPENLDTNVKHFCKGDILLARRNVYLKRAGYVDFEGVTSGDSIVLRVKDPAYLRILPFILNTEDFWDYAEQNSDGTMSKRLSPDDLLEYEFEEPADKKQLADKLWAAYRVKESYRQLLGVTDDFVNAKFVDMFGDPSMETRWETEKLSKLGLLERGVSKARPRNTPDLLGGPYPLVQTGDVTEAELYIKRYTQTYSEKGLAQSRMWNKGTLCITIAANIAQTAILDFDSCFPDSVVGFQANDRVLTIFIHYWFSFVRAIIDKNAPQTAQKNINIAILSDLDVIVPPIELQREFVAIANQAEATKASLRQSIDAIDRVIRSLINQ